MENIANFVVGLFKDLRLSIRWIAIFVCFLLLLFAFYGYETVSGHFYFGKMQQKISLLQSLQQIRDKGIENEPDLLPIYNSAIDDLNNYKVQELVIPLPSIFIIDNQYALGKAISGAFLWIIFGIFGIISDIQKNGRLSTGGFGAIILLFLVAALSAWLGTVVPTILNPWVNYIGFPLLQLFLIVYIYLRSTKKPTTQSVK